MLVLQSYHQARMPRIRKNTIQAQHHEWSLVTQSWTSNVPTNSMWNYVLNNGMTHMIADGDLHHARQRLGDIMFTGFFLEQCYERRFDDFSPVLKLWRIIGIEYAQQCYLDALEKISNVSDWQLQIIRYVVEFLRDAGWKDEAVQIANASVSIHITVLGEDNKETAESQIQLALSLKSCKQTPKAIPIARKALATQRKHLGPDEAKLYVSVNSLASMLAAVEAFEESKSLYQEAVSNRSRLLGEKHPKTLVSIASYAHMLGKMGLHKEAIPLHHKAHLGRKNTLGAMHPKTLNSCINLGNSLMATNQLQKAEEKYLECLQGRLKILGPNHSKTKNAQRKLTLCKERIIANQLPDTH
jgi:tetratricopeptide (TPR) repeat protein